MVFLTRLAPISSPLASLGTSYTPLLHRAYVKVSDISRPWRKTWVFRNALPPLRNAQVLEALNTLVPQHKYTVHRIKIPSVFNVQQEVMCRSRNLVTLMYYSVNPCSATLFNSMATSVRVWEWYSENSVNVVSSAIRIKSVCSDLQQHIPTYL
jgi:DNA-binding helix-hairpin-helix protein with protein kinase domain